MNSEYQDNGTSAPQSILMKRKRGRPRKDRSQSSVEIANTLKTGISRANGQVYQQVNSGADHSESVVGQPITGVIEASFDAGFLLSVKVGNSDTNLRGIVFKPGHYIPVSSQNDVVPHIEMTRRNTVPFPHGHQPQIHATGRRGRGRGRGSRERQLTYSSNGLTPSNNPLVVYREEQVPVIAAAQPPSSLVSSRVTVAPVLLQPTTSLNNRTPAIEAQPITSQPPHLAASRANLTTPGPVGPVETAKGLNPDGSSASQYHDGKSGKSPVSRTPEKMQGMGQPVSSKLHQANRSDLPSQIPSASLNFGDGRTGKMTELLMAVQENLKEKPDNDCGNYDGPGNGRD